MRFYLIKSSVVLLPLIIASALVGATYYFDYSEADIVIRGSLVVTTISIGVLTSFILILFFISRRRNENRIAQIYVQQAKKSKEEHKRFVQRLDHELKNPLTSIKVGLEHVKRNVHGPHEKQIDNMLSQTKRLNQLTNDLRKITVLDEQELELEHFCVSGLLKDMKEMFIEMNHDREIELTLPAAPWPVPNIHADRDLLELALYNIVDNAIKYSDRGDRIEISANDDREFVKIVVADTGLGLAKEELDQVWEELFRGSNTLERSGVGIGLSLVKRIVERHKGVIEFDSKPGVGSRVSIFLPIVSENTPTI